jgi:hypothetical protein
MENLLLYNDRSTINIAEAPKICTFYASLSTPLHMGIDKGGALTTQIFGARIGQLGSGCGREHVRTFRTYIKFIRLGHAEGQA